MNFSSEYVLNTRPKRVSPPLIAIEGEVVKVGDDTVDEIGPNTNVVTIKFNHLKEIKDMHVGDPTKCTSCDAYLSNISKIDFSSTQTKWTCEFCSRENELKIEREEVPTSDDVTYILEAAPRVSGTVPSDEVDSSYIVYCVDISGSMSVSTPIKGNIKLPTDNFKKIQAQKLYENLNESAYNRRTHISRLEAVQVAIADNLAKLKENSPHTKVGLIAFNDQVHVYGDGTMHPLELDGHMLNDTKIIQEKAKKELKELQTIDVSHDKLYDKLIQLEESGLTALGPAVWCSILIAARKPRSKVILCTDGLANKGVGSLENLDDTQSIEFYKEITQFACDKGVSVSIITLKDTDCKLGLLGEMADRTSGIVNIVDPLNLTSEFSSILSETIIATNVQATFLLHRDLFVKDYEHVNNRLSKATRTIGNVTQETEITFEFDVRDDVCNERQLPFQLQIMYTAKDGTRALRILTKLKPITSDRRLAESNADRTILATHFIQSNARLMQSTNEANLQLVTQKHQQWDTYIRNMKTQRSDKFSTENYVKISDEMRRVSIMPRTPNATHSSNNYVNLSDTDASKAYDLVKTKSSQMKK